MKSYLVLSSPSNGACPDDFEDWMKDEDPTWTYCYKQEQHLDITWADASTNCTNKGGSLIIIHNDATMRAMLANSIPVPSWLGMTNNNPPGNIYMR